MSRAVTEGIGFRHARIQLSIIRDLAIQVDSVCSLPGAVREPFIRKMQADVYGLPVVRVNREEGPPTARLCSAR